MIGLAEAVLKLCFMDCSPTLEWSFNMSGSQGIDERFYRIRGLGSSQKYPIQIFSRYFVTIKLVVVLVHNGYVEVL